ncbi:ATP-binding cassette domain-containing protein [Streptomyces sp. NBC_00846]|uniref:ABC transporter ATP-binding protein n=1 Tax=Streptomyces sp. NBC_00846 TaxID=2975849 RepID=UPI003862EAA5|nr:ATP-binding cassette domain-containing protein [Streptomyces sp. NBC_00846]
MPTDPRWRRLRRTQEFSSGSHRGLNRPSRPVRSLAPCSSPTSGASCAAAERRRRRAAEALDSVGLGERLGHLPGEMSGGQQQRVAVARALVKQPKVLLADEPTGNLDESMRDEVMEVLETMWKEHGLTFIMVTHDSAIARRAPRLATIRRGRVTITENAAA